MGKENPRRCEGCANCNGCGQKIRKLNPHSMDKSKIAILEKIAKINQAGHEWVKIQQDHSLIRPGEQKFTIQTDAVHPLRLYWFGLLDRARRRSGQYRINQRGLAFLCGKLSVPEKILCRDSEVVERDKNEVFIGDVKDVVFDRAYWDGYWKRQKPAEPGTPPELKQLELI